MDFKCFYVEEGRKSEECWLEVEVNSQSMVVVVGAGLQKMVLELVASLQRIVVS
jgi:hypothetical protein